MEALGGLLAFVSLVGLGCGLVAMVRPLPRIGLTTRRRGVYAFGVSFLVAALAGTLLPDASTNETDQQVQRPATPEADSPATNASPFSERLNAGASCQELFALRNSADPSSPQIPRMNAALREIGCFSSGSVRTR